MPLDEELAPFHLRGEGMLDRWSFCYNYIFARSRDREVGEARSSVSPNDFLEELLQNAGVFFPVYSVGLFVLVVLFEPCFITTAWRACRRERSYVEHFELCRR